MSSNVSAAASPGALRVSQPPAILRRVVNPVLRVVLESRVRTPLDRRLAVLTYIGRKSNTPRRAVVGYHEVDGAYRVWTHGRWRVNFTGEDAGRAATLRVRGVDLETTGRAVTEVDTVAPRALAVLTSGADPRQLGLRQAPGTTVTEADVRAVVPPLAFVDFTPARGMLDH